MRQKALILDLDNTIFPVNSIGDKLFAPLFDLVKSDEHAAEKFDQIRIEVMRRPFQLVAKQFNFSKDLTDKGMEILKSLSYNEHIDPFPDYRIIKEMQIDKYLVTTGFRKMQQSKVDAMHLQGDFKEIHIIDPVSTDKIKKDVFAEIIERHHYTKSDMLVIGDDLNSEIKGAKDLGIDAVLYDKSGLNKNEKSVIRITDFAELAALF